MGDALVVANVPEEAFMLGGLCDYANGKAVPLADLYRNEAVSLLWAHRAARQLQCCHLRLLQCCHLRRFRRADCLQAAYCQGRDSQPAI